MKQISKTGEEEEADEIWFVSHFQDVSLQKYSILLLYVLRFYFSSNMTWKSKHSLNYIIYSES